MHYLAGYLVVVEAMTMLVIPTTGTGRSWRRASRTSAGRRRDAADRRLGRGDDAHALVARCPRRERRYRCAGPTRSRDAARPPCSGSRIDSWASGSSSPRRSCIVKDTATRSPCRPRRLTLAGTRVVAQIASGRRSGDGTEADVAREVHEVAHRRGSRPCRIRHRGVRGRTRRRPTTARPRAGEPIDIGGGLGGYHSDITRTLWVTGGDPANGRTSDLRHLFGVLHASAATGAVGPGYRSGGGRCARRPIELQATGDAFFHPSRHGRVEGHSRSVRHRR